MTGSDPGYNPSQSMIDRRICVAPMMKCTDRHCRMLLRLISPHSLLFSEMITSGALIHGNAAYFLNHAEDEPCAFQVGGSDPEELKICARLVEDAGYQELNLNVGCPSDKVQHGSIGACLMALPALVASCITAMQSVVDIPVTVKCRIGIDQHDSYDYFRNFINKVASAGCNIFYVHARKAMLQGLSPKQNRDIPPLNYEFVYRIQEEFPDCQFILNGGLKSVDSALDQLKLLDGIMIGRAPYQNPYILSELEQRIFGQKAVSRLSVIDQYVEYGRVCLEQGEQAGHLLRHMLGLFNGCPGAVKFRRHLSDTMHHKDAAMEIVYDALDVSGLAATDPEFLDTRESHVKNY